MYSVIGFRHQGDYSILQNYNTATPKIGNAGFSPTCGGMIFKGFAKSCDFSILRNRENDVSRFGNTDFPHLLGKYDVPFRPDGQNGH